MEARVIGLAGCGKGSLLRALSGADHEAEAASVHVRDERVDALAEVFHPKKKVYAEFNVRRVDLPPGKGTGRRSELERYVRSLGGSELFLHILRAFENYSAGEDPDPVRDLLNLDAEMVLGDLMLIESVLERSRKQPIDAPTAAALGKCKEALETETPLRLVEFTPEEDKLLRGFGLTTEVPQLLLVNTEEEGKFDREGLEEVAGERRVIGFPFSVAAELTELPEEDQLAFAEELGMEGTAQQVVAKATFEALGLISFLTAGEDECRAWAIRKGTLAPQAAGTIHTDLERGFIRAQVVSFDDFVAHGKSMKQCREAGVVRMEGKPYEVRDGDIIEVKFSV